MQGNKVPASVQDVAPDLAEAYGYERLQWQRRRGAYGGLLALAWILLGLQRLLVGRDWIWWALAGVLVAVLGLALWAKRRPAWTGVFLHPDEPRRLPWTKPSRWALAAVGVIWIASGELARDLASPAVQRVLASVQILAGATILFTGTRRMRDQAMLAGLAICTTLAVPALLGVLPSALAFALFLLALGTTWLLVALVRVFAPRGWLVP